MGIGVMLNRTYRFCFCTSFATTSTNSILPNTIQPRLFHPFTLASKHPSTESSALYCEARSGGAEEIAVDAAFPVTPSFASLRFFFRAAGSSQCSEAFLFFRMEQDSRDELEREATSVS